MKTTPAGAFMHQARTQPKSAAFVFNEEVWTYERLAGIDSRSGGVAFRFCSGEQLTRTYDVIGARAFGEQAAVADAVEAVGQHVDEEAADELIDRECHDLPPFAALGAIVRWREADLREKIMSAKCQTRKWCLEAAACKRRLKAKS